MRLLLSVRQLVSRIRVAASPREPAQVAKKRRRSLRKPKGHVAPSPPVRPALAPQAPAFMQLEQGVVERFRAQMCQALQDQLDALTAAEGQASKPICCQKPMSYHDRRSAPCQTWMGSIRVMCRRYRCKICGLEVDEASDHLDVGQQMLGRCEGAERAAAGQRTALNLAGPADSWHGCWVFWDVWRPTLWRQRWPGRSWESR